MKYMYLVAWSRNMEESIHGTLSQSRQVYIYKLCLYYNLFVVASGQTMVC
jgi:hypothetical protein